MANTDYMNYDANTGMPPGMNFNPNTGNNASTQNAFSNPTSPQFIPGNTFVNTAPGANTGVNAPGLGTSSPSNPTVPGTGGAWGPETLDQLKATAAAGGMAAGSPNAIALSNATAPPPVQPPAPPPQSAGATNPGTGLPQVPQDPNAAANNQNMQNLITQLIGRAQQSLNISPSDPTIQAQTNAFAATQERARRNAMNQAAESGNPYATGALSTANTQLTEQAGANTANLQAQLMQNELNARRTDIQNALSEQGSLLTGQQQLALQQELGLVNAAIAQQQVSNQANLGYSQLGLNAENQSNYWNAVNSGVL